jgi:hypothetical protein
VSVADVRGRTGWDLHVSPELSELPPPSEPELAALRALLATVPAAGSSRATTAGGPGGSLPRANSEGAVR